LEVIFSTVIELHALFYSYRG